MEKKYRRELDQLGLLDKTAWEKSIFSSQL